MAAIPFARELAAMCRAEAAEIEDFDPADGAVLAGMVGPGRDPHPVVYQALSEHRAMAARQLEDPAYLRELADCVERGAPSDRLGRYVSEGDRRRYPGL